jgi:hypothetical protein
MLFRLTFFADHAESVQTFAFSSIYRGCSLHHSLVAYMIPILNGNTIDPTQEAYPGWTAGLVWLLVLHSAQREIRERHHYSVDVVSGFYMGVLLWWLTGFLWSKRDELKVLKSKVLLKSEDALVKAAKDGDLEKIRKILSKVEESGHDRSRMTRTDWIYAASVLTTLFAIVLLLFIWTENG